MTAGIGRKCRGTTRRRATQINPDKQNIKATQKRQTLFSTPVSLLLKPNISIWQLLICSPPPPPCPPPPSSPSPTHIFSLTVPVLSRIDFSLRSDSLPSLKEGRKEAVCVFSLKFLSQNYNTLKGETHRHEKAVPCQRGFLAITARVEGVVQGTRQP